MTDNNSWLSPFNKGFIGLANRANMIDCNIAQLKAKASNCNNFAKAGLACSNPNNGNCKSELDRSLKKTCNNPTVEPITVRACGNLMEPEALYLNGHVSTSCACYPPRGNSESR